MNTPEWFHVGHDRGRAIFPKGVFIALLVAVTAALCVAGPLTFSIGAEAPITLSVFVLVISGYLLGPLWGLVPVAAYILLGTMGVPVFSGGVGGVAILFGPTGGYIFGWFLIVFLTGLFVNRFHNPFVQFIGVLAGELAFYLVGVIWYMTVSHALLVIALMFGVLTFLLSNLIQGIAGFLAGLVLRRFLPSVRIEKG